LVSLGRPWVAQGVWPMPVEPCSGHCRSRASRLAILPFAAALDTALHDGGYPGRIVAAVFQPFEAVDNLLDHIASADNADYSAHVLLPPAWTVRESKSPYFLDFRVRMPTKGEPPYPFDGVCSDDLPHMVNSLHAHWCAPIRFTPAIGVQDSGSTYILCSHCLAGLREHIEDFASASRAQTDRR
jgi:hypothetical protein